MGDRSSNHDHAQLNERRPRMGPVVSDSGLVLRTSHVRAGHIGETCKNGRTDRDIVSCDPKNDVSHWRHLMNMTERSVWTAVLHYAKLL